MLVQLSPFQTVKTSVKFPTKSRRRKRNEANVPEFLPIGSSFIATSTNRGLSKWKEQIAELSELKPLLLLSTDHQVSVIGRSKDYTYDEFNALQYSSRPGCVGAFAPQTNGKKSTPIPRIPPILDAKNNRMYALQHGNTRLCCWHPLKASGPDDKNAFKVDLKNAAVSLSLLQIHTGVVYGSCIDGGLFVSRVDCDSNGSDMITVEYIASKIKGSECHVGTAAELPSVAQMSRLARKRKISDSDGRTEVHFYQIFHDDASLHVLCHEVQFDRPSSSRSMLAADGLQLRSAQISMVEDAHEVLSSAKLHVTTSISSPTICVLFRVQRKNHETSERCFAAVLSMETGNFAHNPFELPLGSCQGGMISESILVVTDQKFLYLYDLQTGSALQTRALPQEVIEQGEDWVLCSDSKFGTINAMYEKSGVVNCCISSLLMDGSHENQLSALKLSLSSKIASSLLNEVGHVRSNDMTITSNICEPHLSDAKNQVLVNLVRDALVSLEAARLQVISTSVKELEDFFFVNTYDQCVAMILSNMNSDKGGKGTMADQRNLEDNHHVHLNGHTTLNGVSHKETRRQKNGMNGIRVESTPCAPAFTPPILPQAFIDGAARIVVKLLQSGRIEDQDLVRRVSRARLDARLILSRLLQTRKISARHHFDGMDSIQSSNQEHFLTSALRSVKLTNKRGKRCFSPVDMIVSMLQNCPDVSERQMAVMLNYMMSRALPEDIANIFIEDRRSFLSRRYADMAMNFFSIKASLAKAAGPTRRKPLSSSELEKVGRRLILAGTSYVLYRIVCYSQCNQAMLRVALEDVIEKHQAIILARLLTNIIGSRRSKDIISKYPPSINAVKSICQWVAALCDSFREELSVIHVDGGKSYLTTLLRAINLTTKHSQDIISLKEDVRRVEFEIQAQLESKQSQAFTMTQTHQEDLPGYCVEDLRF